MNRFELFLPVKYFWLVFILFSCVKSQKLKTNPFTPNINVTVEDLENWDFEVTTIDGGFCVYEKQLSEEILMRLPSAIIVCLSILLSVFNLIAHFTFLQFLGSLTFTISVFLVCHFLIEKEGLDKLFDDKMPKEIHNDHPE